MRWRRVSRETIWSRVASRERSSEWRESDLVFWLVISRITLFVAWLISWIRVLRSTNCSVMPRLLVVSIGCRWVSVARSLSMGCCCCRCCWGIVPVSLERTMNLKTSNASGFSGVAAVNPKVFPAGRAATWSVVR